MDDLLEISLGAKLLLVRVSFDRFRTLRLSVRPDGSVSVRAPRKTSKAFIQSHVQGRAEWIFRHLERFRGLQHAAQPLEYISGETHAFLGQGIELAVSQGERNAVRLTNETFEVTTRFPPQPDKVRALLEAWYLSQARELFARIIRDMQPRFDALGVPRPAKLTVRAMTSRWGTCSLARTITLNRHLVRAPLPCVEFVVAHELCHLRHHGHDARFYGLLETVMPDWKARRKRLREVAIQAG